MGSTVRDNKFSKLKMGIKLNVFGIILLVNMFLFVFENLFLKIIINGKDAIY